MLLGHRHYPETYQHLLTHTIWEQAFAWIEEKATHLPDGEHEIQGRELYVNLHHADLLPRHDGVYEAHQYYIDLHYCLEGGELIEWAPVTGLTARTEYDPEKDYTLFELRAEATSCVMMPHTFAIFLPNEAHMPKISDGKNKRVRKAVVKIKMDVLKA
ncbi:MAG: YhcH/YjgK/YiaL family protein [Candidatus Andersenbacteria bacterium]